MQNTYQVLQLRLQTKWWPYGLALLKLGSSGSSEIIDSSVRALLSSRDRTRDSRVIADVWLWRIGVTAVGSSSPCVISEGTGLAIPLVLLRFEPSPFPLFSDVASLLLGLSNPPFILEDRWREVPCFCLDWELPLGPVYYLSCI